MIGAKKNLSQAHEIPHEKGLTTDFFRATHLNTQNKEHL